MIIYNLCGIDAQVTAEDCPGAVRSCFILVHDSMSNGGKL